MDRTIDPHQRWNRMHNYLRLLRATGPVSRPGSGSRWCCCSGSNRLRDWQEQRRQRSSSSSLSQQRLLPLKFILPQRNPWVSLSLILVRKFPKLLVRFRSRIVHYLRAHASNRDPAHLALRPALRSRSDGRTNYSKSS